MARVNWRIMGFPQGMGCQAGLATPADGTSLFSWFRECRANLPVIPNPEDGEWFLSNVVATVDMIVFEMHNDEGQRGLVVVDRRAPSIGF